MMVNVEWFAEIPKALIYRNYIENLILLYWIVEHLIITSIRLLYDKQNWSSATQILPWCLRDRLSRGLISLPYIWIANRRWARYLFFSCLQGSHKTVFSHFSFDHIWYILFISYASSFAELNVDYGFYTFKFHNIKIYLLRGLTTS